MYCAVSTLGLALIPEDTLQNNHSTYSLSRAQPRAAPLPHPHHHSLKTISLFWVCFLLTPGPWGRARYTIKPGPNLAPCPISLPHKGCLPARHLARQDWAVTCSAAAALLMRPANRKSVWFLSTPNRKSLPWWEDWVSLVIYKESPACGSWEACSLGRPEELGPRNISLGEGGELTMATHCLWHLAQSSCHSFSKHSRDTHLCPVGDIGQF